jgi:hypothetical protein
MKDYEELGAIVRRLQGEVRLWKRLVSLLLVAVTMFICSGSKFFEGVPNVVTAREGFALTDREGRVRAFLGFDARDGKVGLGLFDEKGNALTELSINKNMDDYGIYIRDRNRHDRVHTGLREGTYCFGLYDRNKNNRLVIGQHKDSGDSGLSVIDEKGVTRLGLGQKVNTLDGSKMVGIGIIDRNENERISLYDYGDKMSMIQAMDDKGELPKIALGVTYGDETAHLSMSGNGRKECVSLDVTPDNTVTFEIDKNDKTINVLDGLKRAEN